MRCRPRDQLELAGSRSRHEPGRLWSDCLEQLVKPLTPQHLALLFLMKSGAIAISSRHALLLHSSENRVFAADDFARCHFELCDDGILVTAFDARCTTAHQLADPQPRQHGKFKSAQPKRTLYHEDLISVDQSAAKHTGTV